MMTEVRKTSGGPKTVTLQTTIVIRTDGSGLYEFTDRVRSWVMQQSIGVGLLTLFVRHTSASLLIQENADPEVQQDLQAFFHRLVPPSDDPSMAYLRHTYEGPDDMPAHIKASLLGNTLIIPVRSGGLALGTWQGIYLFEHRTASHQRQVFAHLAGE